MHAEKPGVVEVTVGKARKEEMPSVIRIYLDQGGDFTNVGMHNTFVARNKDGLVVGAITIEDLRNLKPGLVNLRTIAVDPDFEGRQVGRQMLKVVLEELKKTNCHTVTVELANFKQVSKDFLFNQGFKEFDPEIMIKEI